MTPIYDACIFWIHCEQEVLDRRLDGRVAKMIQRGMLGEIQEFRSLLRAQGHPFDFTKGILQAIGFKEFAPYLDLPEAERGEVAGQELLQECVREVERSTRKYAKRQLTWINNRTLRMRPQVPIYKLDGSDLARWEDAVVAPAQDEDACRDPLVSAPAPPRMVPALPGLKAAERTNTESLPAPP